MEVESLAELDAWLDAGHGLHGLRLQGLDLAEREQRLLALDPRGAVVLGGTVTDRLEAHLRAGGAIVFPAVTDVPVDPYRSRLYSPDELYAGLDDGYAATPDARAYRWWLDPRTRDDVLATMLRAVHDDSIGDALHEALLGRHVVGVLGGHAVERGTPTFLDTAVLGHLLAADGSLVLTGGGPGAMEAASLGAALRQRPLSDVRTACERLAAVPSFRPDVAAWARAGFAVRDDLADPHDGPDAEQPSSIGIPTWFYGHEPSNVFAGAVAKFFSNAQREDVLLARSGGGLVVLPGAAGTVQEVFQAATPAFYAAAGADVPPVVLVGVEHWTTTLPVWPLLTALAEGRSMAGSVHLVDDVHAAAALLRAKRLS
ncbi:LOG family protein [Angustibacter peucedani]